MNHRKDDGYSLVELLMAILILGIATLPIITSSMMSRHHVARMEHETVAMHLARWQADRIAIAPAGSQWVRDREENISLEGHIYELKTKVLDGDKPDEPPGGTTPLKVIVTVRYQGQEIGRRYLEIIR